MKALWDTKAFSIEGLTCGFLIELSKDSMERIGFSHCELNYYWKQWLSGILCRYFDLLFFLNISFIPYFWCWQIAFWLLWHSCRHDHSLLDGLTSLTSVAYKRHGTIAYFLAGHAWGVGCHEWFAERSKFVSIASSHPCWRSGRFCDMIFVLML